MKKDYILYILFLFLIFVLALIVWPNRWINLDIGNFHYHKLWEGFELSDLTFGSLKNDLNLDFGSDFEKTSEYRLKVSLSESEENPKEKVIEITKLLDARLKASGYNESFVRYYSEGEDYYITVKVDSPLEEFDDLAGTMFSKAKFEVWGESDEEASEEVTLEGEDVFRSLLDQSYDSLNIDGNQMKGFKISKDDESLSVAGDTYYLRIYLSDHQANELTGNIYSFYGKSIVGVLDSQILPIDGEDLGESLQLYQKATSIKIPGLTDEKVALVYGAAIQNGPLPLELEIDDTTETLQKYDLEFLKKEFFICVGVFAGFSIILILLFKFDGIIGILNTGLYCLMSLACLKILPIKLTLVSNLLILLFVGVFMSIMTFYTKKVHQTKKRDNLHFTMFARREKVHKLMLNFAYIGASSIVLIISGPWHAANIAWIVLFNTILYWIVIDLFLPFSYKIASLWFKKD